MLEFTTKSGVDCVINCAEIKDARELRVAILEALKQSEIELKGDSLDLNGLKKKLTGKTIPVDLLNALKDIFIILETSERVYRAVFACLKRCTYNKESIRESTFEDEEARADYYEIVTKCIVENIRPFVKSLLSGLSSSLAAEKA